MRILADENIPLIDAFFSAFGEIRRLPGRVIDRYALSDAEVLLVRSVTRVDRALLEGSQVRFVGTCTIGTDHLDLEYFREAGIAWASAPGCNARGVVDYVLGSLISLAEVHGVDLASRTYGVIGAGQVGGRLIEVLQGLGWRVLICDPLRQAVEGGDYVDLPTILRECDVLSLHTPLTREGSHPTWHLLGRQELAKLREGAWLINASRGAVVDNQALRELLAERRSGGGTRCLGGRAAGGCRSGRFMPYRYAAYCRLQPGRKASRHGADSPGVLPAAGADTAGTPG